MIHALLRCQSSIRVGIKDSAEQISDFFITDIRWYCSELALLNLSEEVQLELSEVWKLADVNYVKDDSAGPDICREAIVGSLTHDIRVHIVRCPTEYVQFFIRAHLLTESEVNDLDVLGGHVHEDVVQLEIAMRVALRVHISDAAGQLFKYVFAGVFRQALIGHLFNVVEDAHSLAQLHDQVDLGPLVDDLVQLHDVRVPEV